MPVDQVLNRGQTPATTLRIYAHPCDRVNHGQKMLDALSTGVGNLVESAAGFSGLNGPCQHPSKLHQCSEPTVRRNPLERVTIPVVPNWSVGNTIR